jgi:hypothetical protein
MSIKRLIPVLLALVLGLNGVRSASGDEPAASRADCLTRLSHAVISQ